MAAPTSTPSTVPMPPSTIAASRKAEFEERRTGRGSPSTSDVGLDRAGDAGEERAAGEREELQAEDVDAHRLGGRLVLADGDPAAADPAVVEPDEDQDDEGDAGAAAGSSSWRSGRAGCRATTCGLPKSKPKNDEVRESRECRWSRR